jgi:Signal transduction histidine kinase
VISEFERDRQGIGRKLEEYAKQKDELQAELEKMQQLAEERKKWEEEQKEKKQDGLVYEAIKYDQDIEEAFKNIQKAIIFKKHFASWFGVTIESIRKDKRRRKCCNIKELLKDFMGTWKEILERNDVQLIFSCDEDILFRCFAFDVENIISNFISNSLASFEREKEEVLDRKEIKVTIEKREEGFILYYEDTGWGLTPKYKKRPELILEAFESDRGIPSESKDEDGTGMGMWIVNRTILEYNGDIDLSENKIMSKGFKAIVSFGGKSEK